MKELEVLKMIELAEAEWAASAQYYWDGYANEKALFMRIYKDAYVMADYQVRKQVVAPLEARLAEAQRIKVEYDRWLSNGVYYTYEEYERDIRPLLNQQAQLSEAQRVIKDW